MSENNIYIDYSEELAYIMEKTGYTEEIINAIFDADREFLVSKGVICVAE